MTAKQEQKQVIRRFMQDHYTDERLAMLLAHAQSGRLSYASCCCFAGVSNAPHALRTAKDRSYSYVAHGIPDWGASAAYGLLVPLLTNMRHTYDPSEAADTIRRRILIPMIRAEMRRRDRAAERRRQSDPNFIETVVLECLPVGA